MGRKISFGAEYKPASTQKLDQLKLQKGERGRVSLLDLPEAAFVHTLSKLLLDEDTGRPVEITMTKADGTPYQKKETEYLGAFQCSGDFDTMTKRGVDPDNCPICKAVTESGAFDKAKRYMVAMVLQYECKPNSSVAQVKPFRGRVLPWKFTDHKWEKIHTIDTEYAENGGVLAMDLMLGPCENGTFQNFEIAAAQKCEWRAEESRRQYVQELLEGYEGDITTLFGREIASNPGEVQKFLREIQDTYDAAYNPSGLPNDNMSSSSEAAVNNLFGEDTAEYGDDEEDEAEQPDASKVKNLSDLVDF